MSKLGNLALLAIRVGVGGTLASHGAQKLYGMFGGKGPEGTAQDFEYLGFPEPRRAAKMAGLGELVGGTSLALGAGTGFGGAAAAGTMGVACTVHAPNGYFNTEGGYEYPAMMGLVSSAVALGGPGTLSLDAATKNVVNKPWMRVLGLLGSLGFAAYTANSRQQPQPSTDQGASQDV